MVFYLGMQPAYRACALCPPKDNLLDYRATQHRVVVVRGSLGLLGITVCLTFHEAYRILMHAPLVVPVLKQRVSIWYWCHATWHRTCSLCSAGIWSMNDYGMRNRPMW